jgi:hypothetical protein
MVTRVDSSGCVWGFETAQAARQYYPQTKLATVIGVPALECPHGCLLVGLQKGYRYFDPTNELIEVIPMCMSVFDGKIDAQQAANTTVLRWEKVLTPTHVANVANKGHLDAATKWTHDQIFSVPLKPSTHDPLCTGALNPAANTMTVNPNYYKECTKAANTYCQAHANDIYCACLTPGDRCDQNSKCYLANPTSTFLIEPHFAETGDCCFGCSAPTAIGAGATESLAGYAIKHTQQCGVDSRDVVIAVVCFFLFALVVFALIADVIAKRSSSNV